MFKKFFTPTNYQDIDAFLFENSKIFKIASVEFQVVPMKTGEVVQCSKELVYRRQSMTQNFKHDYLKTKFFKLVIKITQE